MRLPRIHKGIIPVSLLLITLLFSGVTFAGVPTNVVLNKSVILNLKMPSERISVANPAIADIILLSPRQLQINGLAIGSTSLIVWEKGADKPTFFDVYVAGDIGRLEQQIKEMAPNDSITVEMAKDTIILSGKATNEQTVAKVAAVAKAYAVNVLNHIRIDEPSQVLLQVKVAQVDKSSLKKLGLSGLMSGRTAEGFYNTIGAPTGSVTGISSSSTSTTTTESTLSTVASTALGGLTNLGTYQAGISYFPAGIGAVLQALTTKNLAKVLAEPNLLVKTGQKGNFLAGSKIPYNIVTSTGGTATTSVVFVDVGIKLNFIPEVMDNGLISLKVDPAELSSIAGTLAVNGYPIIDTKEVRTTVELKEGESLVLAGLLDEEHIKTMSKIPLLGDIPILGALFRSSQDDIKEKELVFFITPKLVKPTATGVKTEMPTEKSTKEIEKELRWIPLGN